MAKVQIEVFPWLTELLGGSRTDRMFMDVTIEDGETVRSLLRRLAAQYPEFAQRAFDARTGLPSPLVSVFLNDRFLELAGGLDTALASGDSLTLIPAWEGGSSLSAFSAESPHKELT